MKLLKANEAKHEPQPWGHLTWYASLALGNSQDFTSGICRIRVGQENPRHTHPNCYEVLHVLQGTISHSYNQEKPVVMGEGDSITLPAGSTHNARNVGNQEAILLITFSSGDRKTVGE